MDWIDSKVLVLGLGDTGLSMTRWLARHGARVRVADTRDAPSHPTTGGVYRVDREDDLNWLYSEFGQYRDF